MMKKQFLLSLLCMFGLLNIANAQQVTVQADLDNVTTEGSATYDASTHTVTYNQAWSCAIRIGANEFAGIAAADVDLLVVNSSEAVGGYRLDIYFTDGSSITGSEGAGTKFTDSKPAADNLSQSFDMKTLLAGSTGKKIAYFRFNTPGDASAENLKTRTFTSVALVYTIPVAPTKIVAKEGGEVSIETSPWYTKSEDGAYYQDWTNADRNYNAGGSTAAYFGCYWGGEKLNHYADLSAYKAIRVYQSSSSNVPRAFFAIFEATGHTQVTGFVWNDEEGYYELDLQKAVDQMGHCCLTTLRPTGEAACKKVTLVEKQRTIDYIFSGAGEIDQTVTDALADANACLIDVTGVTAEGLVMNAANPNCLFIANEGVLANEKNVIVNRGINNLVLTDGNPLRIPDDCDYAQKGSYERTTTTEYSTVCLPLCCEFTGTVYICNGIDANNVVHFEEVDPLGLKGSYAFLLKGKGEKITMMNGGQIYHEMDYDQFIGSYSGMTLTSDAKYTYYGFKDNQFSKIGENVVVPPFRAVLRVPATPLEVKTLNVSLGGEETAINNIVDALNSHAAVYNANGVRQDGLQKGLNIIQMQNGATRKVMIK